MSNEDEMPVEPGTVTPYFTVIGADRLIAFLNAVFEARVIRENRYDDGRIQHARLCIGDTVIMLNESSDAYPANVSQMHVYVEFTDATFAAALRAGAEALMAPNDRPHGDRMAGIKDPCGNIWWIASPIDPGPCLEKETCR